MVDTTKNMELKELSNSQIRKLGEKIRKAKKNDLKIEAEDLEKLQQYRVSHKKVLTEIFNVLCRVSRRVHKNSVVVYRLKRMDTIIRKLARPNLTIKLSQMQDIGGCRVIVDSYNQVVQIVNELKHTKEIDLIFERDYVIDPRDTGYRSYHIVAKLKDGSRCVEIQVRTRDHHYWATFVEVVDVIRGTKVKEGEHNPRLQRFHYLMSKNQFEELTPLERSELVEIEKEKRIILDLIKVFRSNYHICVKSWVSSIPLTGNKNFIIMEVNKDLHPQFSFYSSLEETEAEYFDRFDMNEPNRVMIHMDTPKLEKLDQAYTNYILTSHPLVKKYIELLREEILISKKNGDKYDYKKLKQYYSMIIVEIEEKFIAEIVQIKQQSAEASREKVLTKAWRENIRNRIEIVREDHKEFIIKLKDVIPNSFIFKIKNLFDDPY